MIFSALAACSRQGASEMKSGDRAVASSTVEPPASASPGGAATDVEPVRPLAAQTVFERSCKSCHGPDGHGIAAVAPDLRRAPRRTSEEWEKYLRDPNSVHPNSRMPALESLTDEDYQAMAAYLADLTQHNPPPVSVGPAKAK